MSEPTYARAVDVVWRLGPDRVLVRRLACTGNDDHCASDLIGGAAAVWLALDEPGTRAEVSERLADVAGFAVSDDALDQLLTAGWIEVRDVVSGDQ